MPHAVPLPFSVLPFVMLLGLIALAPLWFPDWWAKRYPWVAFGLGALTLAYYGFGLHAHTRILHTAQEYFSFIALIGSLFVVSGGIHLIVKGEATPLANVVFLAIGAVIANLLGTTGASMLLIRPWIRLNRYRITAHHIVFFIFIVSNVGGCLTPIGDPPLFLGYLRGVPFWWVAAQCWPMWLTGVGLLLAIFYFVDRRNYLRAPKEVREKLAEPADTWRFEGLHNLVFLGVILGAVFINHPPFVRESIMIAAAIASLYTTRKHIHEANHFNFHPIQEVAILFAGIMVAKIPALDLLQASASHWGVPTATTFFWGSGVLSSVLDNAPTYLSFLSAAVGAFAGEGATETGGVAALLGSPSAMRCLVALSVGAVFFGANTYIGNGPNFMVKSIADQQRVHTPTFLGYVFRFSLPCMLPVLLVIWLLFFR